MKKSIIALAIVSVFLIAGLVNIVSADDVEYDQYGGTVCNLRKNSDGTYTAFSIWGTKTAYEGKIPKGVLLESITLEYISYSSRPLRTNLPILLPIKISGALV
jgi:hypothetical protein